MKTTSNASTKMKSTPSKNRMAKRPRRKVERKPCPMLIVIRRGELRALAAMAVAASALGCAVTVLEAGATNPEQNETRLALAPGASRSQRLRVGLAGAAAAELSSMARTEGIDIGDYDEDVEDHLTHIRHFRASEREAIVAELLEDADLRSDEVDIEWHETIECVRTYWSEILDLAWRLDSTAGFPELTRRELRRLLDKYAKLEWVSGFAPR